jgi:hypothetical protein
VPGEPGAGRLFFFPGALPCTDCCDYAAGHVPNDCVAAARETGRSVKSIWVGALAAAEQL